MIGPLPYVGGKRRIANRLVSLIPEHTTYVEPFAGGAQVFFQKPRSNVEVLNDLDDDVVNFLRICHRYPQELIAALQWQPASRRLFERHLTQPPDQLTDIDRAARFFYLQHNAWGSHRIRQNFRYAVTKRQNYRPGRIAARLALAATRLRGVQIEHLPYEDVLNRYDRASTFFYCDPPYVGVDLYQHNFSDDQFRDLADRLDRLKGRFLLSINDCTKARLWFGRFHRAKISVLYTALTTPRRFPELLFANYPLDASGPLTVTL